MQDELLYEPAPAGKNAIERFNQQIADITKRSPIGEGWLRVAWGCDEKRYYGGVEMPMVYDPDGKYYGAPYWLLMVWVPSDVYDRREWAQLRYEGGIDVLGEYPRNGSWDLYRICRRDDLSMMPLGAEILEIVRFWRSTNEVPHARARAIADYKRFNEERLARREAAFEEHKAANREELARELAKPAVAAEFSFSKLVNEAGMDSVPAGFTRSKGGLIVPQSTGE